MNPLFKSFYWIPITHKTVRTPCMPCNTPTLRTQPNSPASAPATPEPHFPGPVSSHRATCSFRNIPRPFTPVSLRCSFARRGYYFLTSLPASPSKLSSVSVSALTFASSTTNTPSSVLPNLLQTLRKCRPLLHCLECCPARIHPWTELPRSHSTYLL